MALQRSLSPEGFSIYREVKERLQKANTRASRTASLSALLLARHAEMFSRAMSKKTGKRVSPSEKKKKHLAFDFNAKSKADISSIKQARNIEKDALSENKKASLAEDNFIKTLESEQVEIKNFNESLDRFFSKKYNPKFIHMMKKPAVLKMLTEVGSGDIYIGRGKIQKILDKHDGMSERVFRQLPNALANPIMIFKSSTQMDSVVFVTDLLDDNGVNVVVPCKLNVENGDNIVTSIYGRLYNQDKSLLDLKWIIKHIAKDNTLYLNKEKATKFFTDTKVQFPLRSAKKLNRLFSKILAKEKKIVKGEQTISLPELLRYVLSHYNKNLILHNP